MTVQTVTLDLPELLYQQVARRAQQMKRSVEDELVAAVANVFPTLDSLSADVENDLTQLEFLTDDELWQAAHSALDSVENGRMQTLVLKQQSEGLTAAERQQAENLLTHFDRTMLIRAKAGVLLKRRGHDISSLSPDA